MATKYKSKLMGAIHETATGLRETGTMDKITMREFDVLCLTPTRQAIPKKPETAKEQKIRRDSLRSRFEYDSSKS